MAGINGLLTSLPLAKYGQSIRSAPREVIYSRKAILTAMLYATAALPLRAAWDQGSSAVITSLKSFQDHFGITSATNPSEVRNFLSLNFLGMAVGAALSFFINDRIGRLWSLRSYMTVWIIGQMIAVSAPGLAALYAARIVSGLGCGALTVTGPVSLVEIAPHEIRGLMTAWFTVSMGLFHFLGSITVYGVYLHLSSHSRLQYQVVWFAPCLYLVVIIVLSFWAKESPRWLKRVDQHDKAVMTLTSLRGLPADHPRVLQELRELDHSLGREMSSQEGGLRTNSFASIVRETFLVRANLRRVIQAFLFYALPQLSGANGISSYLVSILALIEGGKGGSTKEHIFITSMYAMCKFPFAIIASLFLIDALGRRKSLFLGVSIQMITDIYIGSYLKVQQEHPVSTGSSQAALGCIFIHAFGYSIGLLTLPYVFGGELWPDRLRSFGASLSQTWHWLMTYAMVFALPSLLDNTDNWGAFIFFAGWCLFALLYVFFMVPEIAGLTTEEIDYMFAGPWFAAYRLTRGTRVHLSPEEEDEHQVEKADVENIEHIECQKDAL